MDPVDAYDAPSARPGAQPQLSISGAGLAPHLELQPICARMTELLVRVLRWHFSLASRIEDPNLVDRVWTAAESTPIVITSSAEWKPQNGNQRPAILVDRLAQAPDMATRGIGDQLQGVRPGNFCHLMKGAHLVNCLGGREGETETLAWEVWRELTRFKQVIASALCLVRFLPDEYGKRVKYGEEDEYKDIYTIPIHCSYAFWESWRILSLDEAEIKTILTGFTLPPR